MEPETGAVREKMEPGLTLRCFHDSLSTEPAVSPCPETPVLLLIEDKREALYINDLKQVRKCSREDGECVTRRAVEQEDRR